MAENFSRGELDAILKIRPNLIVSRGGERNCGLNPRKYSTRFDAGSIYEKGKDRWGECGNKRYAFGVKKQVMYISFPKTLINEQSPFSSSLIVRPVPVVESIRLSELSENGSALILETNINLNGWEGIFGFGSSSLQVRQAFEPSRSCSGFPGRSAGFAETIAFMRSANLANMHYCEFQQVGSMSSEYEYDRRTSTLGVKTLVLRRDGGIQAYSNDEKVRPFFLKPTFQNDPEKVLAARTAADKYVKLLGAYVDQILMVKTSELAEIRQAQKAWLDKNSSSLVSALEEIESNLESISGFEKAIVMMNLRHANAIAVEVERGYAQQLSLDELIRD